MINEQKLSSTDMETILLNQRNLIYSGKTLPYEYRIEQLKKLYNIFKLHELDIYKAIGQDFSKHSFEIGISEVEKIYSEIRKYIKNLKKIMRPKKVKTPWLLFPSKSKVFYEPYGNCLIISPWNYPILLTVLPLIGAIAAGNTAIIKPSEITTNSQNLLSQIINNNFNSNYLYVIKGGVKESTALLQLKFDFIFFTGSTSVGKIIMKAASNNLTPVCLELGGKSPCIIDQGTNLEKVVESICFGKFFNAGQTCIAPDYVYIHKKEYNRFIVILKNQIEEVYSTKPITSIVNLKHFTRLVRLINKKKIIIGNIDKCDEYNLFIPPLVLGNIKWADDIMAEEIFGPILPVLIYEDINEVIASLKRRPKALSLYIFTNKRNFSKQIIQSVSYGGGCINDCLTHFNIPSLPFGGVGESGNGRYNGKESFLLFSNIKSIFEAKYLFKPFFRTPPYTKINFNIFKKFL